MDPSVLLTKPSGNNSGNAAPSKYRLFLNSLTGMIEECLAETFIVLPTDASAVTTAD